MTDRSIEARNLIRSSGLRYKDVASRLGVSVDTVTSWMRPTTSAAHRTPSEPTLRLMRAVLNGQG